MITLPSFKRALKFRMRFTQFWQSGGVRNACSSPNGLSTSYQVGQSPRGRWLRVDTLCMMEVVRRG